MKKETITTTGRNKKHLCRSHESIRSFKHDISHRFCRAQKYLHKQSPQLLNSVSDWDLKTVKWFQKSKTELERFSRPSGCAVSLVICVPQESFTCPIWKEIVFHYSAEKKWCHLNRSLPINALHFGLSTHL